MAEAVVSKPAGVAAEHNNVLRTISYNGVIKEGYLVKKGHIRHNWRTRWFILTRTSLTYFKNREDSHPKGQITLVGASLDCPTNYTKRPWMLKLTTVEGKEYLIEAPDHMSRTQWQLAIEERIRKLDPSKLPVAESKRLSTLEKSRLTLRRSFHLVQNETEISMQRDIVQAMQDSSAGVPLQEIKRGRHVDKCFNGKDAIDWIISWFFAPNRKEAIELANKMLRNGFFHAIENGDGKFSTSMIAADKGKFYEFQDTESANYIFVSFAPVQSVHIFSGIEDDFEECDEACSDSSSPEIPKRLKRPLSMDSVDTLPETNNDDQIIRQGFLLKKGHVRKSWKIRKFVLKHKSTHLCYYKSDKIQTQPQGAIPLLGCVITKLDKEPSSSGSSSSDSSPSPLSKTRSLPSQFRKGITSKPYLFCLQTSQGIKYYIQAASEEERSGWINDLELHIKKLIVSPVNVT